MITTSRFRHFLVHILSQGLRPLIDKCYSLAGFNKVSLSRNAVVDIHLPFFANIPYTTFPSFTYPLNILGSKWELGNFLANAYINLALHPKRLETPMCIGPQMVDSPQIYPLSVIGYFNLYDRTEILSVRNANEIYNSLIDDLEAQRFLFCNVNKFYIPETPYFQKRDFRHPCLIIGCGDDKFTILSYDANGEYRKIKVSIDNLLKGLVSKGRFDNVTGYYHGTPYSLMAIEVSAKQPPTLNKLGILHQLGDYLNSKKSVISYYKFLSLNGQLPEYKALEPTGSKYGIAAVELYRPLIQNFLLAKIPIDMRPTHLLRAHHRLMAKRLQVLKANFFPKEDSDFIEHYNEIVHWVDELHLTLFLWSRGRSESSRLNALLGRFDFMMSKEREILSVAFDKLSLVADN